MKFIIWNSSFSVGVQQMDSQHQVMIDIINQLYEAMQEGSSEIELNKIIDRMVGYTRFHFATEERLLIENVYPEYRKQKSEHDLFTIKAESFQSEIRLGKMALSTEILLFLKKWWTTHIQGEDKKYTAFLKAKGVQ